MIDIWVDAGQMDKLLARYNGATILNVAFQRVQRPLQAELEAEPGRRRAKQPFKTDKQRRYFFWALDAGKIRVPYQRTGGLKRGWKVNFHLSGSQVEMAFTNTAKHAGGVIGVNQWGYHKGHWKQAHVTIKKYEPMIVQAVENEVKRRA